MNFLRPSKKLTVYWSKGILSCESQPNTYPKNYLNKFKTSKKITRLTITVVLTFPTLLFGQYKYNFLKEHFFGRQPSARAEAMGRCYASVDGDLTTAWFNPAGVATIKDLEISGSYASPFYGWDKAKYDFIGVGYKIKDYLIIGLNRNHFTNGPRITFSDIDGNILGIYAPYETNYCLTIASQPVKNLLFGLNTNYFIWKPADRRTTALHFDLGVIKKYNFAQKETIRHSVNLGASVVNFNYGTITSNVFGSKEANNLPVIARLGANYQFNLNQHMFIDSLKIFRFLVQAEYQEVLNCRYESAIRTGAEILLFEIISVRAGYYKEIEYDYGLSSFNYGQIATLTYGFGLQIPLSKLTKIPLNINFDYTSLPQPNYSKVHPQMGNFTTYNLKLNWIFK